MHSPRRAHASSPLAGADMTAPGSVNGGYVGKMGAPAANGNGDLPALGMPPPASMLAPAAAANGAHTWPEAGPSSLQKPGAGAASEAAALLLRTERARKKARLRQAEGISREELERELIPETEGLVPLGAVVARLANYGFETFTNLSETLPTLSSAERRAKIFAAALDVRKQLVKLLVLVQWSKSAPELMVARNLIALICGQFGQAQDAADALIEVRNSLPAARIRTADLASAIDVQGSGEYPRLPSALKDAYVQPAPFSDTEALAIVRELDTALCLRLATVEVVPLQMSDYSIADGRASFFVSKLFEARLTLSGADETDRWYLLDVLFDFRITGAGADIFPRRPKKHARATLLAQTDAELTPRSPAAALEGANEPEGSAAERQEGDAASEAGDFRRRDAPLIRAFNFLQSQALEYQLDILNYQAVQLSRVSWAPTLTAGFEPILRQGDPRTLSLAYWRNRAGPSTAPPPKLGQKVLWNPLAGGSISIRVRDRTRATTAGKSALLSRLLCRDVAAVEATPGQELKEQELNVEWKVAAELEQQLDVGCLTIDAQHLDIETVLLAAVSRHAAAAISELRSRVLKSPLRRILTEVRCVSEAQTQHGRPSHVLQLPLHDRLRLLLRLDAISGRLSLERSKESAEADGPVALSAETLARDSATKRLQEASVLVNDDPKLLVEVLMRQRILAILDDLEQKATYLGLPCTRRMPLRPTEYAKLGAQVSLLYVPLVQCPSYYLVLNIGEASIRAGLMCAGTFIEGAMTVMAVHSVEWLDRERLGRAGALGKRKRDMATAGMQAALDLSIEELSMMHRYSVALVCYHQVEQQLRARGLPFVHVGAATSTSSPPMARPSAAAGPSKPSADAAVPSLCLRAESLLGPTRALVKRNVSLRLVDWSDRMRCRVEISVRLRKALGMASRRITVDEATGDSLEFSRETLVLTFSTRIISDCLSRFFAEWNRIARVTMLARDVARAGRSGKGKGRLELRSFDPERVVFAYDHGLTAVIRWQPSLAQMGNSFYALELSSDDETQPNPHRLVAASLQRMLNGMHDGSSSFWPSFIQLLHDTLPVLRVLAPLADTCLTDADCPEPEFRSATWIRLHFFGHFVLDIRFLRNSKVLFSDGALPLAVCAPPDAQQPLAKKEEDAAAAAAPKADLSQPPRAPRSSNLDQATKEDFAALPQIFNPIPRFGDIAGRVVRLVTAPQPSAPAATAGEAPAARDPLAAINLGRAVLCDCADDVARPVLQSLLDQMRQALAAEPSAAA